MASVVLYPFDEAAIHTRLAVLRVRFHSDYRDSGLTFSQPQALILKEYQILRP